jgi:type II secretory pathway pseudopilin PulG
MTRPDECPPEPRIDRPTKMRWGCIVLLLLVGGVVVVGFGPPFLGTARTRGQITAATLQASGISKALHLYAQDHDGRFPTTESSSNEAFRKLFPDYYESEMGFFVQAGAGWGQGRCRLGAGAGWGQGANLDNFGVGNKGSHGSKRAP